MAKRVFKSDLSIKGINHLIDELENYANVTLPSKTEEFISKLADRGITFARLRTGMLDDLGNVSNAVSLTKEVEPTKDGCKALVIMADEFKIIQEWLRYGQIVQNEVSPTLMYEFGSGQYAIEGHRGTYPRDDGQSPSLGIYPVWKWQELDGTWHSSNGIQPSQPMFHAAQEMYNVAVEVAKEVFST